MTLCIVGSVADSLFEIGRRRGKIALGRFDVAASDDAAA
jgi:hypothetical protein